MEYVEGTPLKGPLPLDQALKYAAQISEALDHAHRKGITHRDLKPANILATKSGIKLLDFGLAKITPTAKPVDDATVTMALTGKNEIVGTLYYMSPEQLQAQADGRELDARSDIFSFGLVLYELLTGKRAMDGSSPASVIAAIMERPAPSIADVAPAALDRVLRKCLAKDPDDRWQTARDLKDELEWIARAPESTAAPVAAPAKSSRLSWLAWAAVGVLAVIAAAAGFGWWRATQPQDHPLTRLSVDLGPDAARDRRVSAILSPDGTRIVFSGATGTGSRQLYTRRLDQNTATLLAPAQSLDLNPFFSPNGEWVAYWVNGDLWKVPAEGGGAVRVTTVSDPRGATWGEDDTIIIGSVNGLLRVSASGGSAEAILKTSGPMQYPQIFPGGEAVLTTSQTSPAISLSSADIDVVLLATGERKNLIRGGFWARYLATGPETGHLVYLRDSTLYGVGFDPQSLKLLGNPVPLLDDVAADIDLLQGGGQFSLSRDGTLVYLSGNGQRAAYPISWLDASGKISPLVAQEGAYGSPRISPDGTQLAYTAPASNGLDLWVYDLARATPRQLTFSGDVVNEVAWAPDSRHLTFQDAKSMWWIRSDGAGQKQLLLDAKVLGDYGAGPRPFSFTPVQNGTTRLAFSPTPQGLPDVWTLLIDLTDPEHPKPGKPEAFLNDPAVVEVDPAFSPDGKFLAFTQVRDIFVRSFPGPGGTWKIASNAKFPVWSPATRQLFFVSNGDDRLMVADYTIQGETFTAGVPRVWSPTPIRRTSVQLNYDVMPDGKRVVMFPRAAAEASTGNLHATFLFNFFDEVRRKIPVR